MNKRKGKSTNGRGPTETVALRRKVSQLEALAQVLSEENGRLRQALLEAESPHWIGCRYCQYTGMVDHVNPHTGEVARDLCPRCSV